ncbi:cupin domain-containing protein [Halorussus salinisoli]|uniref:cupin domain-containing protein n=1 Tax=Halorussus salinisoli TaxID=2558242 RepID=UPI0010C1A7FC|nr:cupin domain-containing protein [Halorussus salinisoli]
MRQSTDELPVRIDTPDAVARQQTDFGDATDYGTLGAERFTLTAGTDITALLEGLEDDLCQSPHWGYLMEGALTVTFADGTTEADKTGDVFYWPPGHTVRADEDSDFVLFSPQHEHGEVLDHIRTKLDEMA